MSIRAICAAAALSGACGLAPLAMAAENPVKDKESPGINVAVNGLKALDQSISDLETARDPAVDINKAMTNDDFAHARALLDQWEKRTPEDKARIQALRELADRAEKEPDEVKRATLVGEGVLQQLQGQLAADKDMLAQLEKKSDDIDRQARQAEAKLAAASQTVYPFTVEAIDGSRHSLAEYKGKVLLIVNTASRCGFTPQYKGLQALYDQYKDKGLVVLGFPANNFMGQEPGANAEIKQFCELKYHVTFPMFAKISVKGGDIAPLYQYLTAESGFNGDITWNFNKFLVDKSGAVVGRFDSKTKPEDSALTAQINGLLK